MSFILGQFNQNFDNNNDKYMSYINDEGEKMKAYRKRKKYNNDVFNESGIEFWDECVMNLPLKKDKHYYFHCKIKKMVLPNGEGSPQRFDIKLVNYKEDFKFEQYIKTIDIAGGIKDIVEWVDIEFIFTPVSNDFNTILFELTRTSSDYSENGSRYPVIVYQELSEINNIIPSGINYTKIGVQSHPGLVMCINGEEIKIGRTGIYELKNGLNISEFSVINAATIIGLEDILDEVGKRPIQSSETSSECLFNTGLFRTRKIDAFTLDYMYEDKGGIK